MINSDDSKFVSINWEQFVFPMAKKYKIPKPFKFDITQIWWSDNFKKELENTKLEYNYLSSSERLIKLQKQYFEDVLDKKDIKNIKNISNKLGIKKITTNDE